MHYKYMHVYVAFAYFHQKVYAHLNRDKLCTYVHMYAQCKNKNQSSLNLVNKDLKFEWDLDI